MQTRAQLLTKSGSAAVYHMAHRLICIALAARVKPDSAPIRKQLGCLKREACQLLKSV